MLNLQQLSLGAPSAERDTKLADYFYESEVYKRLYRREKTIILGNRGAGKSALLKILGENKKKEGCIVLSLSPDSYSYEMLCSVLKSEASGSWHKDNAFAVAWQYLIWVLIMKEVNKEKSFIKTGGRSKIHDYLRDKHKGGQDSSIAVLISYLKRIEGFKLGTFEAGIKTRELERLYKLEEIHDLLPSLVEIVKKRQVIVLVDELDKGWDDSENAKSFVAGLFQASLRINDLTPDITIYISLRNELYESIPALYDDIQKYRDIIETISWDEKALLALVAKRIKYSFPQQLEGRDDNEAWTSVFSEIIQYRNSKSFNYMISRTLNRPREIIQFCTDCLEIEKEKKVYELIDYPIISKAEQKYSAARIKDIDSEYKYQYPALLSVFECFRGGTYTLDRGDLELLCLRIGTGDLRVPQEAEWAKDDDQKLIEILWKVGFLRAYVVGGVKTMRRSGSSYISYYENPTLNLLSVQRFQVHPMFRTFLAMKEDKGKNSKEDDQIDAL